MNELLEFKLDDWGVLKNLFINLNEIIDEVIIECTFDGLKFKGIDRGHICFFEGEISKELFDEYVLEDYLYLYLDLYELVKVLKRGKSKDTFVFKADKETIDVIFNDKNSRVFSLTQIDMNDDMRDLPVLSYAVSFECDFDSINNSLLDGDLYSDRITFSCENDSLFLSCEGTKGKYQNECPLLESVNVNCSATYTIDWLSKIFNTKLSSDNFVINMGDDYPMLIEFKLDFITVTYLLAPRLEND